MSKALSLISKIRETGNGFITAKLKECGYGGLSPSHGDILAFLYQNNKAPMSEIANKIHRTKATVTVLVDKLEKTELVKRDKSLDDTRVTYICLTQKGEKLKPLFEKISSGLNSMLYKDFTAEEELMLDSLLEKMLKNT